MVVVVVAMVVVIQQQQQPGKQPQCDATRLDNAQ